MILKHEKLTPNYLSSREAINVLSQKKPEIPIEWSALCRAFFHNKQGIDQVHVLQIARPNCSWQQSSWKSTHTQRKALLLVLQVSSYVPGFKMRELLLGIERLFAHHPEMPVYFTVIANNDSNSCLQRLYPNRSNLTSVMKKELQIYDSIGNISPAKMAA